MKRKLAAFAALLLSLLLLCGAAAPQRQEVLDPYGAYYDLEHVVLYLDEYDELPLNFITKDDARSLGWNGGSVERYLDGAAIGGDRFGNYEKLLPVAKGRTYTECDLDTDGQNSRGPCRLIFSNDGLYFYTDDHYETFARVTIENGIVEVNWQWN